MIEKWKLETLIDMEMSCLELCEEEWVILLLAVDGFSPIIGEEVFHTCFFLYPYVSFNFKPLLLSVYAQEISEALDRLREKGLLKLDFDYSGLTLKEVFKLTNEGRIIAERVIKRVKKGWIVFKDVLIRKGSKVIEDLTALKKTYNGRGPAELLRLMLNQLNSTSNIFTVRLNSKELSYLKKIYKAYKA